MFTLFIIIWYIIPLLILFAFGLIKIFDQFSGTDYDIIYFAIFIPLLVGVLTTAIVVGISFILHPIIVCS